MKLPERIPANAVTRDKNGSLRIDTAKWLKFMGLENTKENQVELTEAVKRFLVEERTKDIPIIEEWSD